VTQPQQQVRADQDQCQGGAEAEGRSDVGGPVHAEVDTARGDQPGQDERGGRRP
jgi:hypothetical protein